MELRRPGIIPGGAWPTLLADGYYYFVQNGPTGTTAAHGNQSLRVMPFAVPRGVTLTRMFAEVTSAGDTGRSVADGVTTNASTTITSATAAFVSTDQGRLVTGTGIPVNTYISSVTNATTAVLTNAATATATGVSITLSGCIIRMGIYADTGSGLPGALVLDCGLSGSGGLSSSGVISGASNTVQEVTVSQALAPGNYWAGAVVQGVTTTQPTVRTVTPSPTCSVGATALPSAGQTYASLSQTSVTTSLPDPFTASPSIGSIIARLGIKT